MGKKMNERRRKLFTRLMMEGKLDKPLYQRTPKVRKKTTKQLEERMRCLGCRRFADFVPLNKQGLCNRCAPCCKFKYKELPFGFKVCGDCPLTVTSE